MESKIDKIKEVLKKSIKRQIPDSLTYLPNAVKINREIYRQYAGGGREKIVLDILMQIDSIYFFHLIFMLKKIV